MADGNAAYTLPTAIRVGRALERIGLDWFEEPIPQLWPSHAEYAGYDTLAAHLDIPIACGEILQSRGAFKALLDGHKVDIIQPDVTICGGIAECLFVSDLARLQGVQSIPHCWGGAITIAATVHVLSLLPNPTGGPSTETPMLEHDMTPNLVSDRTPGRAAGSERRLGRGSARSGPRHRRRRRCDTTLSGSLSFVPHMGVVGSIH